MPLLSKNNTKLLKGEKEGYLTLGLSLAPGSLSGINMCSHASPDCLRLCLNTSGRGAMSNVQAGRLAKAKRFVADSKAFLADLDLEIKAAVRKAKRLGLKLAIRLNVVSDIPWERTGIIQSNPDVQFYDYTKNPGRALAHARGEFPPNYHLTFSRSEVNQAQVELVLAAGGNVAAVFSDGLPAEWCGRPVIDGDVNDLRFTDPKGVIVGLAAKGKAKHDPSGFVINWRTLATVSAA